MRLARWLDLIFLNNFTSAIHTIGRMETEHSNTIQEVMKSCCVTTLFFQGRNKSIHHDTSRHHLRKET
jgi:hypothetical protein